MKINFSHSIVSFKDKLSSSLTPQQKKIAAIVTVAFSCLAVIYLISRCYSSFQKKKIKNAHMMNFVRNPHQSLLTFPDRHFIFTDPKGKALNGQGKGEFQGNTFEGQFTAGRLNGLGKITGPNEMALLEGEFLENQLSGPGAVSFPGFKGMQILTQLRQSKGKIHTLRSDGKLLEVKSYEGGLKMSDSGLVTHEPFEIRELCEIWGGGRSIGYLFHLPCVTQYFNPNGSLFEGQGTLKSNKATLEGQFRNGLLDGQGKITRSNGTILEGQFQDGQLNGRGKISKSDGRTWEGLFRNGKPLFTEPGKTGLFEGEGNFVFLGTRFEGQFKEGQLNGRGLITEPNGTTYEGQFNDNLLNGPGKIRYSDGTLEEGVFNNGFLAETAIT